MRRSHWHCATFRLKGSALRHSVERLVLDTVFVTFGMQWTGLSSMKDKRRTTDDRQRRRRRTMDDGQRRTTTDDDGGRRRTTEDDGGRRRTTENDEADDDWTDRSLDRSLRARSRRASDAVQGCQKFRHENCRGSRPCPEPNRRPATLAAATLRCQCKPPEPKETAVLLDSQHLYQAVVQTR